MSDSTAREAHSPQPPQHREESGGPLAAGVVLFAGVLLMLDGMFSAIAGVAAIADDDVYTRLGDYVFKLDLTTWGWIHLVVGVAVVITGAGVMKGAGWARAIGVALAALVVLLQFLWLPYQPIWSVVSIAVGVFVIWGLCKDTGREPAAPLGPHD
ncbi:hypothetical protein [Streptomyces sp. Da 82-17]|uniref:DUF7144 family membrane protein n=1 Tax=Streptomyces sp. Da 82-17 TaxID=3377116 RepID=UPI0038D3C99D